MKRRWNLSLGAGFSLVVIGLTSYVPFFVLFPVTRDFPWANLLLLAAGAVLLCAGLIRAFRQPEIYRGKILGSVLGVLSLAGISFFAYGTFYLTRQLPASAGAPRVGQQAPDFTLPDQDGKTVTLAELLRPSPAGAGARDSAVLLLFFRGHW